MTLYMAVTPDKYELPMLIAESKAELARMTGMHRSTVCNEKQARGPEAAQGCQVPVCDRGGGGRWVR